MYFLVSSDLIRMACCSASLVIRSLLWLLTLVTLSGAQRTYQRHCDCEYSVDGRCAYTLLLPMTNSGEMTCPLVNSSESLSRLQDDVGALQTWTGEQAKAIVTLQNTVSTLTDAVQRLQDADHDEDGARESTDTPSDSQSDAIDAVKAAVDQLNRTMVELTALCRSRCSDDDQLTRLERQLVGKYRLCRVRGLIISSINNSAITASSVNHLASASDVRINSTSYYNDSGSWCPSDPSESL